MALIGLREFEAALAKVSTQADAATKRAVARTSALVESGAKKNFEGSHKKGERHTGGKKPNIVTGYLRRSVRTDPIERHGLGDYGTRVAPRAIYSRRVELEYGYAFFTPAAEEAKPKFPEITAEEWRKFLTA